MDSRLRDLERQATVGTADPQTLKRARIRAGLQSPWLEYPVLNLCYELLEQLGQDVSGDVKEYTDARVHIRWDHGTESYRAKKPVALPRMVATWSEGTCLASQVGTSPGYSHDNHQEFRQHALKLLESAP